MSASPEALQPAPRTHVRIQEAAQALHTGASTSVSLVQQCQDQINSHNPRLNAVVLQDVTTSLQTAAQADQTLLQGRPCGPLHGIPFTIKESFDVAGWPTTCGDPARREHRAARHSAVVQRLLDAGAVLLGKTNVPLYLRDWQSYNAVYGVTRNPHDSGRTPGGSSGGSAAAVASGMAFFDVGSDIGSSIRNPAHYCGIFSHKASHGLISLQGHGIDSDDPVPAINCAGPLARSAYDLETIVQVLADLPGDAQRAGQLRLKPDTRSSLAEYRVGIALDDTYCHIDQPVADAISHLGQHLQALGAQVDWQARPAIDSRELWRTYVQMLRASTSLYTPEAAFAQLQSARAGLDPQDDSYATLQVLGATMTHREWLQHEKSVARFQQAWDAYFQHYDLLLCPAAATLAFPHMHEQEPWQRQLQVNGQPQPVVSQLFWAGLGGLCGLPATVAPIRGDAPGLPVGAQIIGNRFQDLSTLRFAQLLEDAGYHWRAPRLDTTPS
ncbi:amidase [Comamonas sp. J-3]|uniref:amidase n=1 Tax=Comamonas trifloxystrobinivorans TaxID=3350256 RepID=UPI003726BA1D